MTETGLCRVCGHEHVVWRDSAGVARVQSHKSPENMSGGHCSGSAKEALEVGPAPWPTPKERSGKG